jgi:cytochrome c-type biogenesis protein CcsB
MLDILAILAVFFYAAALIHFFIKFYFKKQKTLTLGILFTILGMGGHGLDVLVLGLNRGHFPATNLIEASALLTWLMMVIFLILVQREAMDSIGLLLLPIAILSIILSIVFRPAAPFERPSFQTEWIYVHIPLMILSVATLFITFVVAIMYLVQERQLKSKNPAFLFYRLPSLETCEKISYKSLWLGFVLLTLGILTGMIWSKYLRGVYWSWDYKEIWAMITWLLYAVIIHGRMLAAWRGRKAAYLAIIGFGFILFAFAGVSFFLKSYHAF